MMARQPPWRQRARASSTVSVVGLGAVLSQTVQAIPAASSAPSSRLVPGSPTTLGLVTSNTLSQPRALSREGRPATSASCSGLRQGSRGMASRKAPWNILHQHRIKAFITSFPLGLPICSLVQYIPFPPPAQEMGRNWRRFSRLTAKSRFSPLPLEEKGAIMCLTYARPWGTGALRITSQM